MSLPCDHDERFTGVFLLPPEDQGCVACAFERVNTESKRWKELCASMLIHVEPGAGRRRAENYEAEYNDLVHE